MLITFEGIDGSGKSTHVAMLVQWLAHRGYRAVTVREPGGTSLSEGLRAVLLDNSQYIDPVAELMLFCAARRQLVQEVLRPALAAGMVVICDRYADSTFAYQGYGRNLDLSMVRQIIRYAIEEVVPAVTFILDVDVATALRRRGNRVAAGDRMEDASHAFFERVREGYRQLAREEPERVVLLDACKPLEELHQTICTIVQQRLEIVSKH